MSPAEYIDILKNGTVHLHFMNALYILFAYVVAVYLAGAALDRFQTVSLTTIYSIALMLPTNSVYRN